MVVRRVFGIAGLGLAYHFAGCSRTFTAHKAGSVPQRGFSHKLRTVRLPCRHFPVPLQKSCHASGSCERNRWQHGSCVLPGFFGGFCFASFSRPVPVFRLGTHVELYLKSGVMENGVVMETEEGSPQGGNLSPLLANIYLNEFDQEF